MVSKNDSNEFEDFLKQYNLLAFKDCLINEGIERVEDVEDLTDGTMKKLGLTETQAAQLKRKHFDWIQKTKSATTVTAQGEASSKHVQHIDPGSLSQATQVQGKANVLLTKGFFNKDGGKIVHVSSSSLQERYRDVWYKFPCKLKQHLNNAFILGMCQAMEPKFKNIRQLTDWARVEREKRLTLLIGFHPLDDNLAKESKFNQRKSLKWEWNQLQKRYPVSGKIGRFQKDENITKVDGEVLSSYLVDLKSISVKAKSMETVCDKAIMFCLFENKVKEYYSETLQFYRDVKRKGDTLIQELTSHLETVEEAVNRYQTNFGLTLQAKVEKIAQNVNKCKEIRLMK